MPVRPDGGPWRCALLSLGMLHRKEDEGIVLITQPAHAWVSGQLARHWGNSEFEDKSEEVCLAAEQHDIGFMGWEQRPTLDREAGLPYSFLELPSEMHFEIWTDGIQKMLRFGRYPALLVSKHFYWIAKRAAAEKNGKYQELASRFMENQELLQTTLATSLANDFYYGTKFTEDRLRADHEFVSLVDWISLQLLLRFREERIASELPVRPGAACFKLTPLNEGATEVSMGPWPFSCDKVRLVCDGKRLLKPYTDEEAMREGLRAAAPVTIAITLVPA